jgi:hypothetical protein
VRNTQHLCNSAFATHAPAITYPVPSLPWLDVVPSAGNYIYELQVYLGTGTAEIYFDPGNTGCGLMAIELG